nr:hypothetical protein [uncultured Ruegeria sp.]
MSLDYLTDWNQWISSHKELVTLVVVPVVTLTVTAIINRSAEKRSAAASLEAEHRAAQERRLQLELSRRMKLADFRQNWLDHLREDFAVILAFVPEYSKKDEAKFAEVNKRIQSVLLRMNPNEDVPKEIFKQLLKLINEKESIAFELLNLVNLYLKSEWVRLKKELSDYKNLEESL